MTDKTQKGIIGVGSAVFAIVTMLLMNGVMVYECTSTGEYASFDRLSSTHKTGYWFDDSGEIQSKVCRNGEWVEVKLKNEDVKEIINNNITQNTKIIIDGWTCTSNVK